MLQKYLLDIFLFSGLLATAYSIKCYQCSSNDVENPFQCQEYFPDDVTIEPKSCGNVYGARYCVKQVGRFGDGIGTKRYCSSNDLGNVCNYSPEPGDQREFRNCIYTCSTDGCNSGTRLTSVIISLLAPFVLLAV